MSSAQTEDLLTAVPGLIAPSAEPLWYAIHTRAHHEKKVAVQLQQKGIKAFLPVRTEIHRWSDRRKELEIPLFPGYAFGRFIGIEERLSVLRTPGVVRIVGNGECPIPIPDKQIADIQLLLSQQVACAPYPFLTVGQQVRVRGGCLDGLEGRLVSHHSKRGLVISVEAMQRSLIVHIDGYDVEPISNSRQEKRNGTTTSLALV
jgi:transcriptional antiterminator NusG